jgi:hypothetical protein
MGGGAGGPPNVGGGAIDGVSGGDTGGTGAADIDAGVGVGVDAGVGVGEGCPPPYCGGSTGGCSEGGGPPGWSLI